MAQSAPKKQNACSQFKTQTTIGNGNAAADCVDAKLLRLDSFRKSRCKYICKTVYYENSFLICNFTKVVIFCPKVNLGVPFQELLACSNKQDRRGT